MYVCVCVEGGMSSSVSESAAEFAGEASDARRWFEVTVQKTMAEESLSALRMNAFQVRVLCMYVCMSVCMYVYMYI